MSSIVAEQYEFVIGLDTTPPRTLLQLLPALRVPCLITRCFRPARLACHVHRAGYPVEWVTRRRWSSSRALAPSVRS